MRACVAAVDQASMAAPRPGHRLSARPRAWLALWVTALLVTHASWWARVDRARLGTSALAALSWLSRRAKRPWGHRLVASGQGIRASSGITGGSRGSDDPETHRSKTASPRAPLDRLRDPGRGGDSWGQRPVVLLLVTPLLTLPRGLACDQPAPELRAW